MDEILKKLLDSDLLSEDTKTELSAQFKTVVDTYLAEARSTLEIEIRSQLTEQHVKAEEELAVSVNSKIDDFLTSELDELKEDINKFRDLEVEYAEKLVEEKEKLAEMFGEQLNQLVDKLDAFLEVRVDEEMAELKEDIDSVKKLEFGRKIFEAMEAEFKSFRKEDMSTVEQELAEATDKLADAQNKIQKMEASRLAEARSTKLEELLSPLSGNAREQMKIILSNVSTEKLDEAFKVYIGKVLKETVEAKKDEAPVVAIVEDKTPKTPSKVFTGNEEVLTENEVKPNAQVNRMRLLAGVK
jgi:hypothetical protein